jgi:hypothetical protein
VSEENVDSILEAYSDVLEEQTSEESIREATEFKTVPTGKYLVEVMKKELRVAYKPNAETGKAKPDRLRVHLQLAVRDAKTGDKRGVVFTDASPIKGRFENGNLDFPAQLWGHIAGVHDVAKRGINNRDLIEEIGKFAFVADIDDIYLVEGKWQAARTAEVASLFKKQGYRAMNSVKSLKAVA